MAGTPLTDACACEVSPSTCAARGGTGAPSRRGSPLRASTGAHRRWGQLGARQRRGIQRLGRPRGWRSAVAPSFLRKGPEAKVSASARRRSASRLQRRSSGWAPRHAAPRSRAAAAPLELQPGMGPGCWPDRPTSAWKGAAAGTATAGRLRRTACRRPRAAEAPARSSGAVAESGPRGYYISEPWRALLGSLSVVRIFCAQIGLPSINVARRGHTRCGKAPCIHCRLLSAVACAAPRQGHADNARDLTPFRLFRNQCMR